MKVAIVRGAFLNRYDMQNYEPLVRQFDLVGFASLKPIHKQYKFPVIKLPSLMDLPNFPYKMPILNRILGDAHYLFGLEERLKGFDIAHCAETYFYYTQQCLNAKKKGFIKKVVSRMAENIPFNNEGIRKRQDFKRRAIEEVDCFIAITNQAKETLVKEGCNPRKIEVIYPGIDLNNFQFSITNFQLNKKKSNKQINLLFVGRLVEEKGIWDLLEAFKNLKLKIKNLKLKIIGEGILKKEMTKFIKNNGLKSFIEIKNVPYGLMPRIYQEADIFVLPSKKTKYWQEQFGMVLIEAMACGLPIIAYNSGSIPEVCGSTGILVKEGDTNELTKALRLLIENKDLRIKLGLAERKRVEKFFDAEKQAIKIANIYTTLL